MPTRMPRLTNEYPSFIPQFKFLILLISNFYYYLNILTLCLCSTYLGLTPLVIVKLLLYEYVCTSYLYFVLQGDDNPSDTSEVWNLREVSMIHQKVLVIAEVAWDARQVHRPAYLVTWEIDGGGLKGNLFTDTTCVTLSLWPDTAYLIQVSKPSSTIVR